MKKCVECGSEIKGNHLDWSNRRYCSDRCRGRKTLRTSRAWRKEDRKLHPEKYSRKSREVSLKRNYKMSLEEYDKMIVQQKGLCPVCSELLPIIEKENGKHPPVDHNHVTGKPCGVLHNQCNRAIGLLKDRSSLCKKAAEYLERTGR